MTFKPLYPLFLGLSTFSMITLNALPDHLALYQNPHTGHVIGLLGECHYETNDQDFGLHEIESRKNLRIYFNELCQQKNIAFLIEGRQQDLEETQQILLAHLHNKNYDQTTDWFLLPDFFFIRTIAAVSSDIQHQWMCKAFQFQQPIITLQPCDYRENAGRYFTEFIHFYKEKSNQEPDKPLELIIDEVIELLQQMKTSPFTVNDFLNELSIYSYEIKNWSQILNDKEVSEISTFFLARLKEIIDQITITFNDTNTPINESLKHLSYSDILKLIGEYEFINTPFFNLIWADLPDMGFINELIKTIPQQKHAFLLAGSAHTKMVGCYLETMGYKKLVNYQRTGFNIPLSQLDDFFVQYFMFAAQELLRKPGGSNEMS